MVMDSWEEFKKEINRVLERFPDYTEDEELPQLSLFDMEI